VGEKPKGLWVQTRQSRLRFRVSILTLRYAYWEGAIQNRVFASPRKYWTIEYPTTGDIAKLEA
jgi:hypothetical protein